MCMLHVHYWFFNSRFCARDLPIDLCDLTSCAGCLSPFVRSHAAGAIRARAWLLIAFVRVLNAWACGHTCVSVCMCVCPCVYNEPHRALTLPAHRFVYGLVLCTEMRLHGIPQTLQLAASESTYWHKYGMLLYIIHTACMHVYWWSVCVWIWSSRICHFYAAGTIVDVVVDVVVVVPLRHSRQRIFACIVNKCVCLSVCICVTGLLMRRKANEQHKYKPRSEFRSDTIRLRCKACAHSQFCVLAEFMLGMRRE